jgi:DeoR family transcriptional regulator, fructose operon transcriptional repressor
MRSSNTAQHPQESQPPTAKEPSGEWTTSPENEAHRAESRRKAILDHLQKTGMARTTLLSKELGVSEVSIRKDFQFLERRGLLKRVHGGAKMTQSGLACLNLSEKYNVNRTAKQKIASEAVRRLNRSGLQIFLDTGTTTELLAEAIPRDLPLTVITNSLGIIAALAGRPLCKVITLGGVVDYENRIFLGTWIETPLERFHFDFAFLGADSVGGEGFGCNDFAYGEMLHRVVSRSRAAYVLADSSKAGRPVRNLYARAEEITAWITDEGIPRDLLAAFSAKDKPVVIARQENSP